ncbi:MAG: TVP38/TMEM64 family protein [Raoultibacter sp.]
MSETPKNKREEQATTTTGRQVAAPTKNTAHEAAAPETPHATHHEKAHEGLEQQVKVAGHTMTKADIFKFAGLLVFFAIMAVTCYLLWPLMADIFEPGGVDRVIADVRGAGPLGVLILFALQFMQIVVAFIPGEVTQVAAGILYGPWWGTLLILLGCLVSSGFIFMVVKKLGAPFVNSMVSEKHLEKFREFEGSGKLNIIVLVLFLIPGLPKDTFTYLVPLTDMRLKTFLLLTTVGRIPGVFMSTYAASGFVQGRMTESIILFAVGTVLVIICVIFRNKIMAAFNKFFPKK